MTDDYNLRQPPQYDPEQEMGQTTANSALPKMTKLTPQQEREYVKQSRTSLSVDNCKSFQWIAEVQEVQEEIEFLQCWAALAELRRGMKGEADNG